MASHTGHHWYWGALDVCGNPSWALRSSQSQAQPLGPWWCESVTKDSEAGLWILSFWTGIWQQSFHHLLFHTVPTASSGGTCSTETQGCFCDTASAGNANMPVCAPQTLFWTHFSPSISLTEVLYFPEMPQSVVTGDQTQSASLLLRHLDDEHIFGIVLSYREVWVCVI